MSGTTALQGGAATFVPGGATLEGLASAASACEGCSLSALDNRTVFGEGPASARLVLVGEQPGDVEDQRGRPFVGPAGRLLDRAMAEAGLSRDAAYVTNAVKHFSFTYRGKRRLHQTPDSVAVNACAPWLSAELDLLDPDVVVLLGATAGKALLGPSFRVTRSRGVLLPRPSSGAGADDAEVDGQVSLLGGDEGTRTQSFYLPTVHPSAVLRADDERRDDAFAGLVADLRVAAEVLGG